jgi:hypothetical protein
MTDGNARTSATGCSRCGGPHPPEAPCQTSALATDGAMVVFNTGNNIYARSASAGCEATLKPLVSGEGTVSTIALDSGNGYWVGAHGLVRCAEGGCGGSPTVLVASATATSGVAVDATRVYYLQNTTLFSLAK